MRTDIRNPFEELMNPQEAANTHNNYGGGIMAIHNFANDNRLSRLEQTVAEDIESRKRAQDKQDEQDSVYFGRHVQ